MWAVAIYGGLMFAPTSSLGALWGAAFIGAMYHTSREVAGLLISLIFIGWAIGSPTLGWYSDHSGRRLPAMKIGSIGAFITLTLLLAIPHLPIIAAGALLLLFGFFSSGFLPCYSIGKEISPVYATAHRFSIH